MFSHRMCLNKSLITSWFITSEGFLFGVFVAKLRKKIISVSDNCSLALEEVKENSIEVTSLVVPGNMLNLKETSN
jgi:heme/copper-type cytochrome/quinol oxidase subunit 3